MARKKENNYFEMLVENVDCSCRAAEFLYENLKKYDYACLPERIVEQHEIEHEADKKKHVLLEKLLREFLPPIEREDIMMLTNCIDDVTDDLDEVLRNLYMYNVQTLRPEALQMAELLCQSTKAVKEMMEDFHNFRKSTILKEKIIAINHLEEEGDKIYTQAVRRLYSEEKDAVEILVWTTIFGCLEDCCDCCEHVADAVEMAVMKNS